MKSQKIINVKIKPKSTNKKLCLNLETFWF